MVLEHHDAAFASRLPLVASRTSLANPGFYKFKKDGEYHAFAPTVVHALQKAASGGSYDDYRAYSRLVHQRPPTELRDVDGDGRSEGLSIVFEPRDAEERLTAATGNVTITVFDAAAGADPATGEGTPIANWDIPAADIPRHFRRTSRMRGLHFSLPWPGSPPAGSHARVVVRLTPMDGGSPLAADATIATRP